jgi:hypothetical protein
MLPTEQCEGHNIFCGWRHNKNGSGINLYFLSLKKINYSWKY